MKNNRALALRLAVAVSACALLASCSTTEYAKVQTVVPTTKPTAEEIAMLSTLSTTDTSGVVTTETAAIPMQPVDFATNTEVAMAYAVPAPKPLLDGQIAIDTATAPSIALPGIKQVNQPVVTASLDTNQPVEDVSLASNALVETKTRSIEPFVTAHKNSDLNQLISKYAAMYEVPERLVHRVVRRESNYNPGALHKGNWGLMQIRYNTARGLGYDGSAKGLLDAETNLKYAVKYLRGAWIVAGKNEDSADWLYRTGYYYQAKAKGLLDEVQ